MLDFESNMELFIILRSRVSWGLCFRKINRTSGYRMDWKEKGLEMVPILSRLQAKKAALVVLDRNQTYWWSKGEGRVKHCFSLKSIDVQLFSLTFLQLPTYFLCLSSTFYPLICRVLFFR